MIYRSAVDQTATDADGQDWWREFQTEVEAVIDRLVHDAHQLNLKGDSLREKRANLTSSPRSD